MTNKTIETYLENLRKALNGADPATLQDALSDAEEHLSTALESAIDENPDVKGPQSLIKIIEAYGTPEEIAAAYQDVESITQPTLAVSKDQEDAGVFARFFGIFTDPKAWGSFLYIFVAFATGIIYFVWAVVGLSLSISLAIFIFGLPFAAFFVLSARWIGLLEGRIVEALLGVRMPRRPTFFPKELPWQEKLKMAFTNKFTWMIILYMLLQLPIGTIYFTVFVTLIALAFSFMAAPILQEVLQMPILYFNGTAQYVSVEMLPLMFIGGFLLLTITMHLAKYVGTLHGAYAKKVLVSE